MTPDLCTFCHKSLEENPGDCTSILHEDSWSIKLRRNRTILFGLALRRLDWYNGTEWKDEILLSDYEVEQRIKGLHDQGVKMVRIYTPQWQFDQARYKS